MYFCGIESRCILESYAALAVKIMLALCGGRHRRGNGAYLQRIICLCVMSGTPLSQTMRLARSTILQQGLVSSGGITAKQEDEDNEDGTVRTMQAHFSTMPAYFQRDAD